MARTAAREAALIADSRRLRQDLRDDLAAVEAQTGRLMRAVRLALRCLAFGRWVRSVNPLRRH
jgi:hypothetical protein